jgi:DNA-binding CsgD family transcriptional regulator
MQSERPRLTRREIEVLGLVAEGETDGGIARRLGISRKTVGHYLENIYRKLGVSSPSGCDELV